MIDLLKRWLRIGSRKAGAIHTPRVHSSPPFGQAETSKDDRHRFLEMLQSVAASTSAGQAARESRPIDAKKLRTVVGEDIRSGRIDRKLAEQFLREMPQVPQAVHDVMIRRLCERIENTIRAKGREFFGDRDIRFMIPSRRPIVAGPLPTGRLNAMVLKVPESDLYFLDSYIIAVDSGLFYLPQHLAHAVLIPIDVRKEPGGKFFSYDHDAYKRNLAFLDIDPTADADLAALGSAAVAAFATCLAGYVGYTASRTKNAEDVFSSALVLGGHTLPYLDSVLASLVDALKLFVVAHEYGHVAGGHHPQETRTVLIGTQKVEEATYKWDEEFEADMFGLMMMIETAGSGALADANVDQIAYAGADFFFTCDDLIERTRQMFGAEMTNPPTDSTGSHPPSRIRRDRLRQYAPEAVQGLAHFLEWASDLLFEHMQRIHTLAVSR